MEIELGKLYRMVKFPPADYASKYCTEHGFYLGCTCEPVEFTNWTSGDKWHKEPVSVDVKGEQMIMNCGVTFFKEHFEIDYRTMNLNELGI